MQIHDHAPNAWGRSPFFGAAISALGVLLVAAFLTDGFGLLGGGKVAETGPAMLERQGTRSSSPRVPPAPATGRPRCMPNR